MTVRRYSEVNAPLRKLLLWFSMAATGFSVWELFQQFAKEEKTWFALAFWTAAFLTVVVGVVWKLGTMREVVVHGGDEIEFVSLLERQRIAARDIRSIRVKSGKFGKSFSVLHASGEFAVSSGIGDFSQFLSELKQANPQVRLVGFVSKPGPIPRTTKEPM